MFRLKLYLSFLASFVFLNCTDAYLQLDWVSANSAFHQSLYENVLNPEECAEQLAYITGTQSESLALRLKFLESGLRVPRGILQGNFEDWGNYYQCIAIGDDSTDAGITGKYCTIEVTAGQVDETKIAKDIQFNPRHLNVNKSTIEKVRRSINIQRGVDNALGSYDNEKRSMVAGINIPNVDFTLAICIPKSCTVQEGINGIYFNPDTIGIQYEENFCRFKGDKPWVPADYTAAVLFSFIILLAIISTSYDVWQKFKVKADPKSINKLYQSFSVYTNTRRLLTFTSNPGALECVDGIRALSMIWVILGHSFYTLPQRANLLDSVDWTLSIKSLWVTSAPISVDTFFMISGMLLVYTSAEKLTGLKLLKSIHVFYLNRLLRMFPLLAAAVLVQASILFRLTDGPIWSKVAAYTNDCRNYWWSTLLYTQNFFNNRNMCLAHTWYLAIDIQLHILSPIVLYWVLSKNKKVAWSALIVALLAVLTGSTVYNFIMKFQSGVVQPGRLEDAANFNYNYYINTLSRASPFFVGMIFGYLLHVNRGKTVEISKITACFKWLVSLTLTSLVIYSSHPQKDMEWDNQTADSMINSFARPAWCVGLGWIIFACTHGYGGPVNWFLSLYVWKLPSRLSYGMYLFHYPIMYVTAGTAVAPIYFSVVSTLYRFLADTFLAIIVSFTMTLLIDSPFSTLIKMAMGGGPKQARNRNADKEKPALDKEAPSYTKDWTLENGRVYKRDPLDKTKL